MKKKIKEIIVVEGKTDTNKLKSIFDVQTIETNGSEISKETLNLIKLANQTHGVILFLDPDGPGEKIRKTIINYVGDNIKNCFISKKDIKSCSKKIGIAEANDDAIISAIEKISEFNPNMSSITLEEWNKLNINSKQQREIITKHLNISYSNNKQLFKRINMLGLTYNDILNIIIKYENVWK